MVPNVHLMKDDGDLSDDPERYRRIVGKLNYLMVTRPDFAFTVSVVSQLLGSYPCLRSNVGHLWNKFYIT